MITRKSTTKPRQTHSVFNAPRGGTYLQVEWCGLESTPFYIRTNKRDWENLFELLRNCPDVVGVSVVVNGQFKGGRDGAGS